VEVLDIARYVATRNNQMRKLLPAERKMKTLAIKAAKKLLPQYAAALDEIFLMPGFPWGRAPELMARERRIILGRWTPKTNW